MTALTMPARPEHDARLRPVPWRRMAWVTWRQHRAALAGVAVLLGALAVYLWLTGLQMHHAYAADCHPAGSLACGYQLHRQIRRDRDPRQHRPAGGAGADRGVRRSAGAGQGAGDRNLPVRLDPGHRPAALDRRQAGAARGRGDRRGRGVQRAVLPGTTSRASPRATRARSRAACSACSGSRSPPGRWPPSRSASWPGCSSAGSSPRSPPPWPSTPGSPSPPGCGCASTTSHRWSPAARTRPARRGPSAGGTPRAARSRSATMATG